MTRRIASATVLLAAGAFVFRPSDVPGRTATAIRGTFRDVLVERGTIGAARVLSYSSTIPGAQAKILDLVPEGRTVSPGDVLVRFDPAPFEAGVAREAAAVAQADAELIRAREDLRLEAMRADTERAAGRAQVQFAETALAGERDGEGPLAVAEAQSAADEASRQAADASRAVADIRALLARGFATRLEVDRAEQAARDAEDHARVAALRLTTITNFERPAALERTQADVGAARKAVAATEDAAQARLAERRAAVALAQSRAEDARARLAAARDQVERTTVRATAGGLVVYRELFFGTEKRKPQAGDEVWPNQPLVAIPDPTQLVVETAVRETDLHRVNGNPRVTVAVDAFPDLAAEGEIAFVGALAQEEAGRTGTRTFDVTIRLKHSDPRLRTGMSARVNIQTRELDDVVLVPVDALERRDGRTRCLVVQRGTLHAMDITVAAVNDTVAAVASGLHAGDVVRVFDPDGASEESRR